jgi:hypothetical protein
MSRTISPRSGIFGSGLVPFRKKITYAIENTVIDLCRFPAYSSIICGGVHILTAFNDSGTDTLDVGFRDGSSTDDPNGIATLLAIDAVGFIAFDELAATTNIMQTKPWILTCTYNGENNNASAGVAYVQGIVMCGPTDGS